MRNSKQQARYLLAKFDRAIEQSLNLPENLSWTESLKNGTSHLYQIKNYFPTDYESPLEILQKNYRYCLEGIRTLQPEEDYIPFNEFREVIDKLPESLNPEIFQTLTNKDKEKFGFSLWEAYEESEVSFGLGDDGTDEMEQNIELLGIIVSHYKESSKPDEEALSLILKMLLYSNYNIDIDGLIPTIYLNSADYYNILKYIEKNGVMYNQFSMLFEHIQTEHLEPYYNETTHPANLCLSDPELEMIIEATKFYFEFDLCHDPDKEEIALMKSIKEKLEMELYARNQITE